MYFTLFAWLMLAAFHVSAAPWNTGDPMPILVFEDQHGEKQQLDVEAGFLVFAPDRDAADIAHDHFKNLPAGELTRKGVVYLSDISTLPSLVTSMFALPKMRDYSYRLLLGYEASETADFPHVEGHLSLLRVVNRLIADIQFAVTWSSFL